MDDADLEVVDEHDDGGSGEGSAHADVVQPAVDAQAARVTLPYVLEIADLGIRQAAMTDPALARGASTVGGRLTSSQVARAHGVPWVKLADVLR